MSQPAITLWSDARYYSPWVFSVYVVLKEKGLNFTLKTVDLTEQAGICSNGYISGLTHQLSVLEIENFLLSESSTIAACLEDSFLLLYGSTLILSRGKNGPESVKYRPGCVAIFFPFIKRDPPALFWGLRSILR